MERLSRAIQATTLRVMSSAPFACALLITAVALVFGQTLGFGFLSWDDPKYVTGNPQVLTGLSLDGLAWAFETKHFGLWTPLTWLSHMADVSLWGLSAAGHHLSSVGLHAIAALFLYGFLRQATGASLRSLAVTLIFAAHPLRAESVAWISERKDVLAAMFWMATLFFYARHVKSGRRIDRIATLAAAVCAGLSKPVAVMLPAILVIVDLWPLRRFDFVREPWAAFIGSVREKWLLFVLAAMLAVWTLVPGEDVGLPPRELMAEFSLAQRLQIAVAAYGTYLWKLFWPVSLSFYYPARFPIPWPEWVLPAVVLAALTALAWRHRAARPEFLAGLAWYLASLLPSSGIVQIADYSHADRYSYIALIGITWCLAWLMPAEAFRRTGGLATSALLGVALVGMIALAHWQVGFWRDSKVLYTRAVELDADNRIARLALSDAYFERGDFDAARNHALHLLRQQPPDNFSAIAQLYLGDMAHREGRQADAEAAWWRAAQMDPNYWRAALRLGTAALTAGRLHEAIAHLQHAERLAPRKVEVLNNLGVAWMRLDNAAEALKAYQRAVEANPLISISRLNLARTYERLGQTREAHREYSAMLSLVPDAREAQAGWARTRP